LRLDQFLQETTPSEEQFAAGSFRIQIEHVFTAVNCYGFSRMQGKSGFAMTGWGSKYY
jgi:hypothetical protein